MLSPMTVALAFLVLLSQAAASVPLPTTPQPALPQNTTPPTIAAPPPPDPATSAFAGEAGLILVAIKPTATADYELVIRTLNEALSKDTDPSRKAAAAGWRVLKAVEADAKGNALYIHVMLPAVAGFDYRPTLLVDALVKELAPDMLSNYRDAFAGPPSKLNLTELANMTVAPVTPPPATAPAVPGAAPAKPTGVAPTKPPEVKKPGGEQASAFRTRCSRRRKSAGRSNGGARRATETRGSPA